MILYLPQVHVRPMPEDKMPGRHYRNLNDVKDMLRQEGMYLVESSDEVERMLDVMVRFYAEDALFIWLCGGEFDPVTAKNLIRAGVVSMTNAIAYADSPDFNAAAAWIPPGSKSLPAVPYLRNGGYEIIKRGGLSMLYRLIRYQGCANRVHKKITGKEDWYLFAFAVDPKFDSYEYSEKILRPITRYAWETGDACYGEVNSDRGINIMKTAGFQVRAQGKIPGSRVNHYGVMV